MSYTVHAHPGLHLRLRSNDSLLEIASYTGRAISRHYDAVVARRIISERIAIGDVEGLDFERCAALRIVTDD